MLKTYLVGTGPEVRILSFSFRVPWSLESAVARLEADQRWSRSPPPPPDRRDTESLRGLTCPLPHFAGNRAQVADEQGFRLADPAVVNVSRPRSSQPFPRPMPERHRRRRSSLLTPLLPPLTLTFSTLQRVVQLPPADGRPCGVLCVQVSPHPVAARGASTLAPQPPLDARAYTSRSLQVLLGEHCAQGLNG